MKTSTSEGRHGIQWTDRMQLDDLDFTDDLALLTQTQQQMQEKTTTVAAVSAAVGLNIHKGKIKILRYNSACTNPITIDGEDLEDVKIFTYLGSIIDEQGGSDADVKARIVGGSQQETLDPGFVLLGTRQQGVPVILRKLVLPGGFDLMSSSFTVRDVTTQLSEPRLQVHLADECQVARNPGPGFPADYLQPSKSRYTNYFR
ncbi:unnamed protein product [Schistosoma curassoni]|uniref:Reverse transcriptase domain-containing protein n=1 Tax=Schistosoma curassoni TaxID=6186 RepID=A0A183K4V6_9TREM|nr:unnamed protein product [Schistosoma curassoni]